MRRPAASPHLLIGHGVQPHAIVHERYAGGSGAPVDPELSQHLRGDQRMRRLVGQISTHTGLNEPPVKFRLRPPAQHRRHGRQSRRFRDAAHHDAVATRCAATRCSSTIASRKRRRPKRPMPKTPQVSDVAKTIDRRNPRVDNMSQALPARLCRTGARAGRGAHSAHQHRHLLRQRADRPGHADGRRRPAHVARPCRRSRWAASWAPSRPAPAR